MHPRALILNQQGFSLAETAIALAVIAVVIGLMVPTLLSVRVAEQARATTQNLQTVMRSIAAFVQSSGCVPCPMPASFVGSEAHGIVRGDTSASPARCGTVCPVSVGIVPFRSLGLPESFAKDAYGHWLTYAADKSLGVFTELPSIDANTHLVANQICQANLSTTNRLHVFGNNGSQQVAVLLLSHGANGRGIYRNTPTDNDDRILMPSPLCTDADKGYENCNASKSDNLNFYAMMAKQGTNPFDDIFLYLDRNNLMTYLGNQGCNTTW